MRKKLYCMGMNRRTYHFHSFFQFLQILSDSLSWIFHQKEKLYLLFYKNDEEVSKWFNCIIIKFSLTK